MARFFVSGFSGLLLLSFSLIPSVLSNAAEESGAGKPIKVRWLLAHQPADAFRRAAKIFSDDLRRESKGTMELVVLEPKDVGSNSDNVEPKRIFELLANGDVELSQTVTTGIGELEPSFWVLDLPFLFKDHAHATRVLDGPIGGELLAKLEKRNVHGLAFTYSGGFRVIPSTARAIRKVGDFEGMRIRTTNSPVAQAMLRNLGATPVPLSLEDGHGALRSGTVDAAETTYIRVTSVVGNTSKYLNETEHSLFLTSILAGEKFFRTLTPEQRDLIKRVALKAARLEREDSVNDGLKLKKVFQDSGMEIVTMSRSERRGFERRLRPIYGKFEPVFGRELVARIRAEARN